MKTASDKLFRLVKSMTPSEKRYFKRHFASEGSTLTEIFDAINGQPSYNEDQLKRMFTPKVAGNLKVYKFQLEQVLLKTLVAYRHMNTVSSRIRIGLEQVDILVERNLIDMAIKQLEKVKKECIKFEENTYLLEIMTKEYRLRYIRLDNPNMTGSPQIPEYLDTIDYLRDTYLGLQELNWLSALYAEKQSPSEEEEDRVRAYIAEQEEKLEKGNDESIKVRGSSLVGLGLASAVLGDKQRALDFLNKVLLLFDERKGYKEHYAYYFMGALRYCLDICIQLKEYNKALSLIKKGSAFLEKNDLYKAQNIHLINARFFVLLASGKTSEITEEQETAVLKQLKQLDLNYENATLQCYLFLAASFLAEGQPKKIRQYTRELQRADRHAYAYFEEVTKMIEFFRQEMDDDSLKVKTYLRKLNRQGIDNGLYPNSPVYAAFLIYVNRLIEEPENEGMLTETFLEALADSAEDRVAQLIYKVQLHRFFEGRVKGVPFKELLSA